MHLEDWIPTRPTQLRIEWAMEVEDEDEEKEDVAEEFLLSSPLAIAIGDGLANRVVEEDGPLPKSSLAIQEWRRCVTCWSEQYVCSGWDFALRLEIESDGCLRRIRKLIAIRSLCVYYKRGLWVPWEGNLYPPSLLQMDYIRGFFFQSLC